MTEPRTTSLFPNEWQSLCHGSALQLASFFASVPGITEDGVRRADEHIDRMRAFTHAWRAAVAQQEVERVQVNETAEVPQARAANGAEPPAAEPVKRRGRPRGSKNKGAEAVQ